MDVFKTKFLLHIGLLLGVNVTKLYIFDNEYFFLFFDAKLGHFIAKSFLREI
jgi:hypothetical protein